MGGNCSAGSFSHGGLCCTLLAVFCFSSFPSQHTGLPQALFFEGRPGSCTVVVWALSLLQSAWCSIMAVCHCPQGQAPVPFVLYSYAVFSHVGYH